MIGRKRISELITNPALIHPGRINIIEANVSAGKTHFALNTIPAWTGNPERILYLIDTQNGEYRLLENVLTVSRQTYAFCEYGKERTWGEILHDADGKMPLMTYAGFGSEVRNGGPDFRWHDYDYIVCDEMQNLIKYQQFKGNKVNHEAAEAALRQILLENRTKVIALSATPQAIWERFGDLCRDVPFDRSDLCQLETFAEVPYKERVEEVIACEKGKTGILFTENIADMKRYIAFANGIGVRANGFWSTRAETQAVHRMDDAQWALRDTVLWDETLPADLDLLVINKASETCIKIDGKRRKVDYMIVHDKDKETQIQVRGRYHGDLPIFYYHDIAAANDLACRHIPERFLNVRLYADEREELCACLDLRKEHDPYNGHYKWPTVRKQLMEYGFEVVGKKDSKRNGQYYFVITAKGTNLGELL